MTINQLIEILTTDIKNLSINKPLFIVGISGLDASGKSQIAEILAKNLKDKGKNVLSFSGNSMQFPRKYKEDFQEKDWVTQHIRRTINFEKMINELFKPLNKFPTSLQLDAVDYDTNKILQNSISLDYPLIVIVESIYLFSKKMKKFFDYKIFLDISISEAFNRAKLRKRDFMLYGNQEGIKRKYEMKNFPGYLKFDKMENPKGHADVIVDNNNWNDPIIIKRLIKTV